MRLSDILRAGMAQDSGENQPAFGEYLHQGQSVSFRCCSQGTERHYAK